jgi:hypothetical protein
VRKRERERERGREVREARMPLKRCKRPLIRQRERGRERESERERVEERERERERRRINHFGGERKRSVEGNKDLNEINSTSDYL